MPITNTIPVATATKWIDNWRNSNHSLSLSNDLFVKGFLIPGDDLTEVMNETGATDARTYLAIDDDGAFHLLVVGVDADGNDMVDEDQGWNVYDFTRPCPPTCSKTGPFA